MTSYFIPHKEMSAGAWSYGSEKNEAGEYELGASVTFDQYKQDQAVQMHYSEQNRDKYYVFSLYDRLDASMSDRIDEANRIKESTLPGVGKSKELDKF